MVEILIIVLIISLQTFFGYIENKLLGSILPIISVLLYIYLIIQGVIHISIMQVLLPFVGFFALISVWQGGRETKRTRRKKELQKMKAQDGKKHD